MERVNEEHHIGIHGLDRSNLKTLSTYLKELKPNDTVEFSMHGYFDTEEGDAGTNCGTSGCAVGHGPYAGIPKSRVESWTDYSHRSFINIKKDTYGSKAWDWCFSGSWHDLDNTPEGAAIRIDYMLEHGIPTSFDECGLDCIADEGDENPWYEVVA